MKCPKCGNDYCKMIAESEVRGKDYSICHGLIGEICFGPAGFLCGISDSRKMDVVCKKCGHRFKT